MMYEAARIIVTSHYYINAVEVDLISTNHSFHFLLSGVNTLTTGILVSCLLLGRPGEHQSYPNANMHASFYPFML